MVESVYCAVRTDSLCKAGFVGPYKCQIVKVKQELLNASECFDYRKACGYLRAAKLVSAQCRLALNLICLHFMFDLFNEAVGSSGFVASNGRIITD